MTTTETKHPYRVRMENWDIEQHKDCANFQRVKEWSIANGYVLHSDVSYNGFLEVRKTICEGHPSDGHRLELQIFCNESVDTKDKYHSLDQYDMEIDFENDSIFKPMKYRYKMQHGLDKSKGTKDLEELLAFTLKREAILKAEHEQFLKENPTTDWELINSETFQYVRMVRGTYEFKEFDRIKLKNIFDKFKIAKRERVEAFIKEEFENEFLWIQKKVLLFNYKEQELEEIISPECKSLIEFKQKHGDKWEMVICKIIFGIESELV